MARKTKSWSVEITRKGDSYTAEYHVVADNEDEAKTVAWSAYCQEHLTDIESEKFIDAAELPQTFWVQL